MASTLDDLLTVQEAAQRLDVSPSTLYRAISEGRLPATRERYGRIVIHRDDLAAYEPCYDPPCLRVGRSAKVERVTRSVEAVQEDDWGA